ncbi:MAG: SAVED domain-containing protein [Mariprofundus sp.]|nr:SAVED domain-containing protein [Mariprofundus sp.]
MTYLWNKIKWLFLYYAEIRKKSFPLAILGTKIVLGSLAVFSVEGFIINLMFPEGLQFKQFQFSSGDISLYSMIIGTLGFIGGFWLIWVDIEKLQKQIRRTARVLITGMFGTSKRFPNELLSKSEQIDSREVIELGEEEQSEAIDKQITIYNAEQAVQIYKRFILNHDCSKVYLGGLTRVPFLVAYGACFRAVSAKVIYFDRFHRGGDWKLLNDEDESISIAEYDIGKLRPDAKGNVGLALGFSTAIQKGQLPEFIADHTLMLVPNIQTDRNLVKNQDNLHQISGKVQKIIDHLSSLSGCKKIHLFLSVQSTLGLDIGKRYQEGIHKNWVIHNFNSTLSKYDWAIELSKEGVSRFQLND